MNIINDIQMWYKNSCNGDWEHGGGFNIENIDNPGWLVKCDIEGTTLEGLSFKEVEIYRESEDNWLFCKVENNVFIGSGGPLKLEKILKIFIDWTKSI